MLKPFSYVAPKSLEEAYQVLAQADGPGEVRPLVGGTDLIDQMKQNRRTPSVVMDIKRIPEMMRLEWVPGEGLHLGAAVPCTDTAAFPAVKEHFPSLEESCLLVGSIQIQNRASVGANICNSAPSADTVPSLITYSARVVIVGPSGRREVPLEEFFTGPSQNVLAPNEILLETIISPLPYPPHPPHIVVRAALASASHIYPPRKLTRQHFIPSTQTMRHLKYARRSYMPRP